MTNGCTMGVRSMTHGGFADAEPLWVSFVFTDVFMWHTYKKYFFFWSRYKKYFTLVLPYPFPLFILLLLLFHAKLNSSNLAIILGKLIRDLIKKIIKMRFH